MIDINYTLIVQMVNFLTLMVILHFMLYRPMKRLFDEREARVNGALAEAESIRGKADATLKGYEDAIKAAKADGHSLFTSLCREGGNEQRRDMEEATEKARKDMEAMVARIAEESAGTREALSREMAVISGTIASKLMGRPV